MLQFPPIICHIPTPQYIVLFVPLSFSGNPQITWKYNALYHLISEYSSNGIIHKAEEEAFGIATERYRRDNQIPDSDGFAMIMLRDKRGRSETMSTNLSDKHDTIGPDMQGYQRLYHSGVHS